MISDERQSAFRTAVAVQLLTIVGLSIDGAYWQVSHGWVPRAHLTGLGVAILWLLVLFARRRHPSEVLGATAVLSNTVFVLLALWLADGILAREPRAWVPFQSHKLGVVATALIAPCPTWVGALCIVAFTALSVVQYVEFPASVQAHLAIGEPWASLAFGAFALGVFIYRKRGLRIERETAWAHAETKSLEKRLARVSFAVRDLSNTPLQTLRLATAMVRRRHPEEAVGKLDRMERALGRLEQLEKALARYEAGVAWCPGDESFDPLVVIEETGHRRSGECEGDEGVATAKGQSPPEKTTRLAARADDRLSRAYFDYRPARA